MKCLSLWQPWAELVRRGLKIVETRGWELPASYIDKPLAIHAARQVFKPLNWGEDFRKQLLNDEVLAQPLIYGAVLCIVHPQKPVPAVAIRDSLTRRELLYGNYEEFDADTGKRRYAFPFEDIRVLPKPVPLIGHQGIFDWPQGEVMYREYCW